MVSIISFITIWRTWSYIYKLSCDTFVTLIIASRELQEACRDGGSCLFGHFKSGGLDWWSQAAELAVPFTPTIKMVTIPSSFIQVGEGVLLAFC